MRTCKPAELMFKPDDGGKLELSVGVDEPSAPIVTLLKLDIPRADEFDLKTPEGVDAYVVAVNESKDDIAQLIENYERYEGEVDKYVETVNAALDEALENFDPAELFQTFTNEDVRTEIDRAGIVPGDECVMIPRGHYDRLVGDGSACVFDPSGACIHRECGLTRETLGSR